MEYSKRQRFALDKLNVAIASVRKALAKPRITIDFETRCELDIKKVGAYKYSQHPSCEILMMGYSLTGEEKDTRLWVMGMKSPKALFALLANGYKLNAFNKYFERCIWKNVAVKKLGWPDIEYEDLFDTGDKCQALALPASLDKATEVTKVDHTKNSDGKALIKVFCCPKTKNGKLYFVQPEDEPEKWQRFGQYCIDDVKATIALDKILPDLSPMEQMISWLTDKMNWRGIYLDMTAVRAAAKLADKVKSHYNKEASKLSGGMFEKCTQRAKVKEWLKTQDFTLPNMQGDTIAVAMRRDDLAPKVRRMLELYVICGSTAASKFTAMENYVCDDGRVHELLNYHKARTGRWGGKGIQIQNLPRPVLPKFVDYVDVIALIKRGDVDELEAYAISISALDEKKAKAKGKSKWWKANPMQVLTSCLRAVICSMMDKHYKCADYSAIEARVLLWLAGDTKALDIFRRGEDIYLDMASTIYGVPVSTLNKESDERPLGKEAILGCGFGMGDDKFRKRCDEKAGIKIDKKLAKHVITTYRKKYKKVKELWYKAEEAAIEAVQNPGRVTRYKGIKYVMKRMGKMTILLCKFPSGHTTGYPYPKVKMALTDWGSEKLELTYEGHDSYTHKWTQLKTYGGKLVENFTQGVARDLMAFGMLLLDLVDYFLVMTVHDEAVSEDDEDFGSLKDFEHLLCTLPRWAEGLPVTSEGWVDVRYRK